jgi:protein required for attachment to host cells
MSQLKSRPVRQGERKGDHAMVGIPGLYFVIANDDHARFVRPDPDNGLHTIEVVNVRDCHPRDGPADPTQTGESPHVRCACRLAKRIDEGFAVDLFSHLVLVAPPRFLGFRVSALDSTTNESLYGSLAKDLVAVPDLELWPHFLPWLQPQHVCWGSALAMKAPRFR